MFKYIHIMKKSIFLSMTLLFMVFIPSAYSQSELLDEEAASSRHLVALKFSNDVEVKVELADTHETRRLGLMYRRKMCDNCGMLFKFDSIRVASIWMKNTYIPLDLAYINAFGNIVDIFALEPHDLTSVPSSMPVLYALEMNQGWFAENGISEGDSVSIPEYIKPANIN